MGAGASKSKVKALEPIKGGRSSSATTAKSASSVFSRGKKARPESGPVIGRGVASAASNDSGILTGGASAPSREEVLSSLRSEGLLGAAAEGRAGVCYEVPLGELQPAKRRPPPRLAKLESRQAQMDVTKQQIKEKLEKAERRRKRREEEKIERSKEKDARNLEVKLALLEIEKNKEKELSRAVNLNVSSHLQRRATRVDEIIAKQKENDRKISEAQKRKLLSPRPQGLTADEISMMTPKLSPRNLDDVPIPTLSRKK